MIGRAAMSKPGRPTAKARLTYRARDGLDVSRIVDAADTPLSIGRSPGTDVTLAHDPRVSRLHAQLDWIAGAWLVLDGGLSANGTYVESTRVAGRQRLAPGDVISVGDTNLRFEALKPPERAQITDDERRRLMLRLGDDDRALLAALGRSLTEDPARMAATDTQLGQLLDTAPAAVHVRVQQLIAWLRVDIVCSANARHALAAFAARSEDGDLG